MTQCQKQKGFFPDTDARELPCLCVVKLAGGSNAQASGCCGQTQVLRRVASIQRNIKLPQ